jgi:uncharacterized protein involved in exopolysaccharide biosynthesis
MRFAETSLDRPVSALTRRDLAAIVFRQKRIFFISFVLGLLIIVFSGLLTPQYQAQMEILVRRERLEPVMSYEPSPTQSNSEEVTEAELNSEVEFLNSQELLRKVVLANGLEKTKHLFAGHRGGTANESDIAKATERLHAKLNAEPVRKTDVIAVSFQAADPQMAVRVLRSLAGLYVEKHLEVHRPSGEFKFLDQQTERYRNGLKEAEIRLKSFTDGQGIVSAGMERDLTLEKMEELKENYERTQAQIAETAQRIRNLEQQAGSLPVRQVTQVRTSDNPQLMQQMKSTLLNLDLKRTELLTKYDPSYRLVQEVDKQISDTRAAIAKEEDTPIREETSDQDPTHEWVKTELTKAKTDLAGLQASATANEMSLRKYRESASKLQDASIVQQDLVRNEKTQEENYLLYLHKEEQARIDDALDQRGILNVAIVDQPTVPALPMRSSFPYGVLSILLMASASFGIALISDFFSPSFRTPNEVTAYLGAPVLAALPKHNRTPRIEEEWS